jgi:hypothetical protein
MLAQQRSYDDELPDFYSGIAATRNCCWQRPHMRHKQEVLRDYSASILIGQRLVLGAGHIKPAHERAPNYQHKDDTAIDK